MKKPAESKTRPSKCKRQASSAFHGLELAKLVRKKLTLSLYVALGARKCPRRGAPRQRRGSAAAAPRKGILRSGLSKAAGPKASASNLKTLSSEDGREKISFLRMRALASACLG